MEKYVGDDFLHFNKYEEHMKISGFLREY